MQSWWYTAPAGSGGGKRAPASRPLARAAATAGRGPRNVPGLGSPACRLGQGELIQEGAIVGGQHAVAHVGGVCLHHHVPVLQPHRVKDAGAEEVDVGGSARRPRALQPGRQAGRRGGGGRGWAGSGGTAGAWSDAGCRGEKGHWRCRAAAQLAQQSGSSTTTRTTGPASTAAALGSPITRCSGALAVPSAFAPRQRPR